MKYNEIIKAHNLYQCGLSVGKVATKLGVNRGCLWGHFKRLGLPLRPRNFREHVFYKGIKYTLDDDNNFRATKGKRTFLHRLIWQEHNGAIAENLDIYRIDGDNKNYSIENLTLKTKSEINNLRGFVNNQWTKRWADNYDFNAVECNQCGHITKRGEDRHFSRRKFCSRDCYNKWMKGKPLNAKSKVIKIKL